MPAGRARRVVRPPRRRQAAVEEAALLSASSPLSACECFGDADAITAEGHSARRARQPSPAMLHDG